MIEVIAFGLFGLIVGSFLNVLVLRWGERPLTGRSECPSCRRTIPWYDLVPIFSWFVLRGRCRECRAQISIQYPLVELSTGVVFAVIGAAPIIDILKVFALPIAALLIAIAVYDFRTGFIPDAWVYAFAGLTLLSSFVSLWIAPVNSFTTFGILIGGPIVALPLFVLWAVSRGTWMGFGDVKLALGMGWLLGPALGLVAVFLAFVVGAVASLPLLFFSSGLWRRARDRITPTAQSQSAPLAYTMKSEIPFGPFLIASCLLIWFLQIYGIPFPLGSLAIY